MKERIKISDNPKTQAQLHMLLAISKMQEWFDSLSEEEKFDFWKEHPDLVVLKND